MLKEEKEKIQKQIYDLKKQLKDAYMEEKLNTIHQNEKLVGKCFKIDVEKHTQFYKVISEFSSNEYRVECITFALPFVPNISPLLNMIEDRYPDCEIEASPFSTESIMIECTSKNIAINKMNEITENDFDEAMDECYKQFKKFSKEKDVIKEQNGQLIYRKD